MFLNTSLDKTINFYHLLKFFSSFIFSKVSCKPCFLRSSKINNWVRIIKKVSFKVNIIINKHIFHLSCTFRDLVKSLLETMHQTGNYVAIIFSSQLQFSSIECFDKNLADQKTCIIMNNNHFYHWVFMREQNNQKHFWFFPSSNIIYYWWIFNFHTPRSWFHKLLQMSPQDIITKHLIWERQVEKFSP